jgi:hypothetical protein
MRVRTRIRDARIRDARQARSVNLHRIVGKASCAEQARTSAAFDDATRGGQRKAVVSQAFPDT